MVCLGWVVIDDEWKSEKETVKRMIVYLSRYDRGANGKLFGWVRFRTNILYVSMHGQYNAYTPRTRDC